MNPKKKNIDIVGSPLIPIAVGYAAWIDEGGDTRRTSTVLSLEKVSQTEIRFETMNTNYRLRILQPDALHQGVHAG